MRARNVLIVVGVAAVALAGCGGGSGDKEAGSSSPVGSSPSAPAGDGQSPVATGTATIPGSSAPAPSSAAPTISTPTKPAGGQTIATSGAPKGFQPQSTSWISLKTGYLLGCDPAKKPNCSTLIKTTDGGKTWASLAVPDAVNVKAAGGDQYRVRFAEENHGFIFGPAFFQSADGGKTWKQESAGGPMASNVTSFEISGNNGIGVEGEPARVIHCQKDQYWCNPPGTPNPPSGNAKVQIQGSSTWINADGSGLLYNSGNFSTDWSLKKTPCQARAYSALDPMQLVLGCATNAGAGSSTKTIYYSPDAGDTWQKISSPPNKNGQLTDLAAGSQHNISYTAVSGASQLMSSTDGGKTWTTALSFGDGGKGFTDLGFTNENVGVVVYGAPLLAGDGAPAFYRTSDGGKSWDKYSF